MIEIITAIIIFATDLVSKTLVLKHMELGQSIKIIPNFFHLTYLQNTGIAFGVFHGKNIFILILLLILFPVLIFSMHSDLKKHYLQNKNKLCFRLAIGFFIGGACGNLLDRIFRGYVVDLFDFLIWPVFNIADSFICISIALLSYFTILQHKGEK